MHGLHLLKNKLSLYSGDTAAVLETEVVCVGVKILISHLQMKTDKSGLLKVLTVLFPISRVLISDDYLPINSKAYDKTLEINLLSFFI